jgi:hypothetical protein
VLLASAAHAQSSSSALAENLFREGKKLLDKKSYAEACPKLAESARLDPASGTLLALGLCHEGQGKTASAWADFTEAASVARRDNRPDREKAAIKEAAALEPKLARVTYDVASSTTRGLEIRQDDVVLGSAAWKDSPIDPGEHAIEAIAPGKTPFKTTFTIGASEKKTVSVPALEDEPVHGPAPIETTPEKTGSPVRTAGFVIGGVGIASLVGSGILGGLAIAKNSDGKSACPTKTCANPSGVDANHAAETFADVSTVLFIAGAVLTAAGVTLVIVSPSKRRTTGFVVSPVGAWGTW